jgi:D-alanyl-lipoteichoic acid acyltransferase DltB (MBOAT superfamily)
MTFTSLEYYLFLPLVFLVYHFAGQGARRWWLLLASYFFYGSLRIPYLPLVLAGVTLLTWACGLCMVSESARRNRLFLWIGVGGNILILGALKYQPFLTENLNLLGSALGAGWVLPVTPGLISIGVSFFVFQAIGYLLDISLDLAEPEHNFGLFALSLAFFPKLLQGPIEQNRDFIPRLAEPYRFDYASVRMGLLMIAGGLFKKVVIADRLARYVNPVYDHVHDYSGVVLILATYLYALQLYFDFAGYTDIALGSARVFGIPLTQNFNSPYLATTVADFWRRWHISFSRWILEYLFKPLQMHWRNWRTGGTALALLTAFLISGLWHGASWCFVVWGGLHGLYLAAGVYWQPYRKKLYSLAGVKKGWLSTVWQVFVTFHLVCFTWIFFRAQSLSDAWYVVTHLFAGVAFTRSYLLLNGVIELFILFVVMAMYIFIAIQKLSLHNNLAEKLFAQSLWVRWAIYWGMLFVIIYYGVYDSSSKFVYYQF